MDAKLAELVALYERVDALYADWSCPGSTECCRFGITGRQPYVTAIELSLLRHALAGRGGPLSPRRRALPLQPRGPDERTCPLLDRSGRCAVYAARPLGCRTFYCERAQRGVGPAREELRELVRELQDLAARHQLGGELARPLTHALEAG
ncbi:MAG TPA: YkgJ family cysteine cluster protein [Polyangiales bacterium]|nr:YkgJ family cysteine cluster protein [Polyangiales bacterium]